LTLSLHLNHIVLTFREKCLFIVEIKYLVAWSGLGLQQLSFDSYLVGGAENAGEENAAPAHS